MSPPISTTGNVGRPLMLQRVKGARVEVQCSRCMLTRAGAIRVFGDMFVIEGKVSITMSLSALAESCDPPSQRMRVA